MRNLLQKLFRPHKTDVITVVSGLPRSGTSMMMRMLAEGGIAPLTDEIRQADADNPRGYYELERVKQLSAGDTAWLDEASGRSVKVISALLKQLPTSYQYQVVFMQREISEILASQRQMLIRRNEPIDEKAEAHLANQYRSHLTQIRRWLRERDNFRTLYLNYAEVIRAPQRAATQLDQFIAQPLNCPAMVQVVEAKLYRQRQ